MHQEFKTNVRIQKNIEILNLSRADNPYMQ